LLLIPEMLAGKNVIVGEISKKCERKEGQYAFEIPTLENSIGVTTANMSNQLQNLKLKGEVTYELKDQAYCYMIFKVPEDFSSLSAHLTIWLSEVESCKYFFYIMDQTIYCSCYPMAMSPVHKLDAMFNAAMFAVNSCEKLPFLRADIKAKFTPRAVARILHGIASPAYPSTYWSKTHFWGRYTKIDFHAVMEAAKVELINVVGKDAT
ncbi:hypothetical protein UlMin_039879, partial [Ulmus minor]